MKLTPTTGDFRRHDAGTIYQAHIRAYEVRDGDYGQYILWLCEGPELADDTKLMTSAAISKRSKLGQWYKLLYPTYAFDTEVDLDTLIGVPVAVMFDQTERDDGGWDEKGKIVAQGTLPIRDYPVDETTAPL